MTAKQWLIQYLIANGYSTQGFKSWSSNRAEAVYVFAEGDISYVARSLAQINGGKVIFIQHLIPVDFWHDQKSFGQTMLYSFKPIHAIKEFVEEMEEHYFLDLATMTYPESWQLKMPEIRNIEHIKANLLNISEIEDGYKIVKRLEGKISVDMISFYAAESLDNQIEEYKRELVETGLVVGAEIEYSGYFDFDENIEYAETKVFEASDSNNAVIDYEFWMTTMAAGDYYFFVTLLTPARDEDFFKWSRNTQTYKVVSENIKPLVSITSEVDQEE